MPLELVKREESTISLNVTLTPTLESLVKNKVAAGLYSSPSEVMNEALRMMQEQDHVRNRGQTTVFPTNSLPLK